MHFLWGPLDVGSLTACEARMQQYKVQTLSVLKALLDYTWKILGLIQTIIYILHCITLLGVGTWVLVLQLNFVGRSQILYLSTLTNGGELEFIHLYNLNREWVSITWLVALTLLSSPSNYALRALVLKNANAISKGNLAFAALKSSASKNCKGKYCKFFCNAATMQFYL